MNSTTEVRETTLRETLKLWDKFQAEDNPPWSVEDPEVIDAARDLVARGVGGEALSRVVRIFDGEDYLHRDLWQMIMAFELKTTFAIAQRLRQAGIDPDVI